MRGKRGVDTGLYYYGARYYDPRISIWLSVDPLAEKYYDRSPYEYCFSNPMNLIDPTGMGPEGHWVQNGKLIYDDGIEDGKLYHVDDDFVFDGKNIEDLKNNSNLATSEGHTQDLECFKSICIGIAKDVGIDNYMNTDNILFTYSSGLLGAEVDIISADIIESDFYGNENQTLLQLVMNSKEDITLNFKYNYFTYGINDNYYNIKSMLEHEKDHLETGPSFFMNNFGKDPVTPGTFGVYMNIHEKEVFDRQINSSLFNNTTDKFQKIMREQRENADAGNYFNF